MWFKKGQASTVFSTLLNLSWEQGQVQLLQQTILYQTRNVSSVQCSKIALTMSRITLTMLETGKMKLMLMKMEILFSSIEQLFTILEILMNPLLLVQLKNLLRTLRIMKADQQQLKKQELMLDCLIFNYIMLSDNW